MAPRDTSPLAFLNALWSDGRVTLTWGPPQFTGNGETLIGYEVSILKFGPNSTQPIQTILNIQPPTSNQVNLGVLQTYQHSTGGDIAGFRIDPIFGRTVDGTQTVVRGTGLFVKYGSAIGTFGL